jgi:hypothetical protein
VKKFSQLNPTLLESTVRGMKKKYEAAKKGSQTEAEIRIKMKKQKRGRRVQLGVWDDHVQKYVRGLRKAGARVNRHIVVAAARGILMRNQPSLLQTNEGKHILSNSWARSLLKRMKYVKRKGTKAARKVRPHLLSCYE